MGSSRVLLNGSMLLGATCLSARWSLVLRVVLVICTINGQWQIVRRSCGLHSRPATHVLPRLRAHGAWQAGWPAGYVYSSPSSAPSMSCCRFCSSFSSFSLLRCTCRGEGRWQHCHSDALPQTPHCVQGCPLLAGRRRFHPSKHSTHRCRRLGLARLGKKACHGQEEPPQHRTKEHGGGAPLPPPWPCPASLLRAKKQRQYPEYNRAHRCRRLGLACLLLLPRRLLCRQVREPLFLHKQTE